MYIPKHMYTSNDIYVYIKLQNFDKDEMCYNENVKLRTRFFKIAMFCYIKY